MLPDGFSDCYTTQEMVLSDESSRPYYIYDPYERGISDSGKRAGIAVHSDRSSSSASLHFNCRPSFSTESLPAYLWYTSAVGGWDHPLVRFIVADILASSGMTEQSTALLEVGRAQCHVPEVGRAGRQDLMCCVLHCVGSAPPISADTSP